MIKTVNVKKEDLYVLAKLLDNLYISMFTTYEANKIEIYRCEKEFKYWKNTVDYIASKLEYYLGKTGESVKEWWESVKEKEKDLKEGKIRVIKLFRLERENLKEERGYVSS